MPRGYKGGPWSEEKIRENARKRLARKSVAMPNGCIEWTGAKYHTGYGSTGFGTDVKHATAHRVAFALAHNLPRRFDGVVCHKCDNPACINVDHLFLGTHADNVRDKVAKGRHPRGVDASNARLTPADVRAIRADARAYKKIAPDYDIHWVYVGKIKRREVWAHVD